MSGNMPPTYSTKNPKASSATTPFGQRFGIGGTQKPETVYVGDTGPKGSAGESFSNIDVVKGNWALLSPEATKKIARDAQNYAGRSKPLPLWNLPSFWESMVDVAYKAQMQFGERITPLEAYDWYAKKFGKKLGSAAGGSATGGSSGGGGGPAAPTKRVNLTDPDTANGLVDNALEQYLGRRANNKEQTAFRQALRKAEMKNPVSAEIVGDTAVTKGGVAPSVRAEEFAMAQEGSAEYQAGTTYYDAFIKAIKNPVGI
jgi:hypothetical protein